MIPSLPGPRGWDVYIWTHCNSDPFTLSPTNFSSFSKGTLPRLCRSSETGVEGGSSGYITSSNSSNRWRMEMYNTLNVWRGTILSRGWQYPTIHWNYTVSQKQINMGFAGWVEPVFANLETSSLKMPNQLISGPIPETALPCPGERRTRWWGLSRRTPWPQTRPILRLSGCNFKFWGRKMITQCYISEEIPQIKMNFIFDRPWRDGRCKMCKIRQITFQVLSKAVLKYIFVVGSTPWL